MSHRIPHRRVAGAGLVLALSAAIAPFGAQAAPIAYEVHLSITNSPNLCQPFYSDPCVTYTLDGTVTTDGTVGDWGGVDHFTGTQLVLSDGTNSALLDQSVYAATGNIRASDLELRLAASFGSLTFHDSTVPQSSWILCSNFNAACLQSVILVPNGTQLENFIPDAEDGFYLIGVVPEPSTGFLLAIGLLFLVARGRLAPRAVPSSAERPMEPRG